MSSNFFQNKRHLKRRDSMVSPPSRKNKTHEKGIVVCSLNWRRWQPFFASNVPHPHIKLINAPYEVMQSSIKCHYIICEIWHCMWKFSCELSLAINILFIHAYHDFDLSMLNPAAMTEWRQRRITGELWRFVKRPLGRIIFLLQLLCFI